MYLDGSPADESVLNYARELQQRARLSIDCLLIGGQAAEARIPALAHAAVADVATTNGHAGPTATAPLPDQALVAQWLALTLSSVTSVGGAQLPESLRERSPFVDLVLMSAETFRSWLMPRLGRVTLPALRAPLYLPPDDDRLPSRVLVPSDIGLVRMVTPLRRYLYPQGQLVLFTCARGQSQQKRVVGYVQAHDEAPGYYAVDAMEGRGLEPMLAPQSLLVVSLSADMACASHVEQVMPLLGERYAGWGLSFLVLP